MLVSYQVSLTTEEYENECREREKMAAVMKDREKEWSTLERQLKKEISDLNERVRYVLSVQLRNQQQHFERQVAQVVLERDNLKDELEKKILELERRNENLLEYHSVSYQKLLPIMIKH